jgi:protoheme IX farnesyltransferase
MRAVDLSAGSVQDYVNLTKPRVVLLHLLTAAAAMFLAAEGRPPDSILVGVLAGGGMTAGAANIFNCYFDRDIDSTMERTRNRPLPSGRVSPAEALAFGAVSGLAGLAILYQLVSLTAALLALGAMVYYVIIYTVWLKRRTRWSSLAGSGAGAFPPLIGWTAVTGRVEMLPFLLFALIILWTPPHTWSLGFFRRQDYARAGLPVVPGRHGPLWIIIFSLALGALSLFLATAAGLGAVYLGAASTLGLGLLALAVRLQLRPGSREARVLYFYSIFYLATLFGTMMADRL